MKNKLIPHLLATLLGVALTTTLHAQTSAFTYQGQLTENGAPARGIYDLRFTIYDLSTGGSMVAGPVTNSPVVVSNGLFTVTLDFIDKKSLFAPRPVLDAARVSAQRRGGRSSMVERKPSKLHTKVRFPSPAPPHPLECGGKAKRDTALAYLGTSSG
jgi:hypothetical protein